MHKVKVFACNLVSKKKFSSFYPISGIEGVFKDRILASMVLYPPDIQHDYFKKKCFDLLTEGVLSAGKMFANMLLYALFPLI